jgi:hypothetical protein
VAAIRSFGISFLGRLWSDRQILWLSLAYAYERNASPSTAADAEMIGLVKALSFGVRPAVRAL